MEVIAGQNILSRGLPKTGQITSFSAYDDGYYQKGWWLRRLFANNRQRFLIKTISGVEVVIDKATMLMWPKNSDEPGGNNGNLIDWWAALAWAKALSFAGFSDWRIPNIMELFSLCNFENFCPAVYWPFLPDYIYPSQYWSSTTYVHDEVAACYVNFLDGSIMNDDKINANRVLAVRSRR